MIIEDQTLHVLRLLRRPGPRSATWQQLISTVFCSNRWVWSSSEEHSPLRLRSGWPAARAVSMRLIDTRRRGRVVDQLSSIVHSPYIGVSIRNDAGRGATAGVSRANECEIYARPRIGLASAGAFSLVCGLTPSKVTYRLLEGRDPCLTIDRGLPMRRVRFCCLC